MLRKELNKMTNLEILTSRFKQLEYMVFAYGIKKIELSIADLNMRLIELRDDAADYLKQEKDKAPAHEIIYLIYDVVGYIDRLS
jgi:hypothetical protein